MITDYELPGTTAWPFERKCPECGKIFCVPSDTDAWAYQIRDGRNTKLLCSYRCLRNREKRETEKKAAAARKAMKISNPKARNALIRRMVLTGMTNDEICGKTGFSRQLVNYYRKKTEEEFAEKEGKKDGN